VFDLLASRILQPQMHYSVPSHSTSSQALGVTTGSLMAHTWAASCTTSCGGEAGLGLIPSGLKGKHRGSDVCTHTQTLSIIPIQTQRFFNLSHTLTSLNHIHAHSPCSSSHHTSVSKPSVTFEFGPSGIEVLLPMKSQHQSIIGFEDPKHFAQATDPSGQHFHFALLKK